MPDAAERLVNLALFLAGAGHPVSAQDCRDAGLGYPDDQDEAAFARMFERDKDALRSTGLAIEVVEFDGEQAYTLDASATFASRIELTAEDLDTLGAVAAAVLPDPSFPLPDALRFALLKIAPVSELGEASARCLLADERPAEQGAAAAVLFQAISSRKRVVFDYTNATGLQAVHDAEPYSLFLRDGRWYLVGRDVARDETRVFALTRMRELRANAQRSHSPDFERPAGLDPRAFVRLPFQYGSERFIATLRFSCDSAWRAERLSAGLGELSSAEDGSTIWRIEAGSVEALLRWVIENGPGIVVIQPAEACRKLADGLAAVVEAHAR